MASLPGVSWLCVILIDDLKTSVKRFIKVESDMTIGEFIVDLNIDENKQVKKIVGHTSDPQSACSTAATVGIDLPTDMPIITAMASFGIKFMEVRITKLVENTENIAKAKSIIDVLMKASKTYDWLPDKK